jgi:hypothetical protein
MIFERFTPILGRHESHDVPSSYYAAKYVANFRYVIYEGLFSSVAEHCSRKAGVGSSNLSGGKVDPFVLSFSWQREQNLRVRLKIWPKIYIVFKSTDVLLMIVLPKGQSRGGVSGLWVVCIALFRCDLRKPWCWSVDTYVEKHLETLFDPSQVTTFPMSSHEEEMVILYVHCTYPLLHYTHSCST